MMGIEEMEKSSSNLKDNRLIHHLLEDRELADKFKIVSCFLQKRFFSKKNEVYLVKFIDAAGEEREWVVKKFSTPKGGLTRESDLLTRLKLMGLPAPELIYAGNNFLILNYIQGMTLLDWLEQKEKEALGEIIQIEAFKILKEMALWLKSFYTICSEQQKTKLTLGDVNLRNFIVGNKFYGLDFENCKKGLVEEDIGKICAFALTYTPSFTAWKYNLVDLIKKIMSEALTITTDSINVVMLKELDQIMQRRASRERG